MSENLKWYIAWTTWRAEYRARANLEQRGYEVLVPTRKVEVRHAGRRMLVQRPIFPRYLFVGVPDDGSWYPILSTVAVVGLITNHGQPVALPKWIMTTLRAADEAGAFNDKVQVAPDLKEGDEVRFVGGPYAQFVGKVMSVPNAQRVGVILDMFGKKHKLSVPLADLAAA